MENKINLTQLADLYAQESGISKSSAEQFVKCFFDTISDSVISDGITKVKGFGTFKLIDTDDRESINVNTGERFTISGRKKIVFVPDTELKEAVNRPFSAFDTQIISERQAEEFEKIENEGIDPDAIAASKAQTIFNETPAVREITQTHSQVVLLKLSAWVLSVVLVLSVGIYALWPALALDMMEKIMKYNPELPVKTVQPLEPAVMDSIFADTVMVQADTATVAADIQPLADTVSQSEPAVEEPANIEPVETKPAETKPIEIKTVETKPAEAKPVETKLVETKPVETKQVKPAETKPVETKPSETKPAGKLVLTAVDESKDLSEFSVADTVNYRIVGIRTVHVMKSGETLAKLALDYYGSKKLWPYIAKCNSDLRLNSISPGSKIKIPIIENR